MSENAFCLPCAKEEQYLLQLVTHLLPFLFKLQVILRQDLPVLSSRLSHAVHDTVVLLLCLYQLPACQQHRCTRDDLFCCSPFKRPFQLSVVTHCDHCSHLAVHAVPAMQQHCKVRHARKTTVVFFTLPHSLSPHIRSVEHGSLLMVSTQQTARGECVVRQPHGTAADVSMGAPQSQVEFACESGSLLTCIRRILHSRALPQNCA